MTFEFKNKPITGELKKGDIVWDIDGNMYEYVGTVDEDVHVVLELYVSQDPRDGSPIEEYSEPRTFLGKLYKDRVAFEQKKHEKECELVSLQRKIARAKENKENLEQAIDTLQREFDRIKETSPEDLLREKLKSLNAGVLADLKLDYINENIYYVSEAGGLPVNTKEIYVTIRLIDGSLQILHIDEDNKKCKRIGTKIFSETIYTDKDVAHKKVLDNISKESLGLYSRKYPLNDALILDEWFDEYNIERPAQWKTYIKDIYEHRLSILCSSRDRLTSDVKTDLQRRADLKKEIKEIKEKLSSY